MVQDLLDQIVERLLERKLWIIDNESKILDEVTNPNAMNVKGCN